MGRLDVDTEAGTVVGQVVGLAGAEVDGGVSVGVNTWRAIPYAAPPVGRRRWRPPEPVPPWDGPRPAGGRGPMAPQSVGGVSLLPAEEMGTDEDCLTLNVAAPASAEPESCPVMVWIHGGGFTGGTGASVFYDIAGLAGRAGVVAVSINYRLGALGWLAHPVLADGEGQPAGNWGLLDQLAALRWVRDNIAGFGGNPGNVTVFGESAGAMSIGAMLAVHGASGLFARAILQSGSRLVSPLSSAAVIAEAVLAELNCPITPAGVEQARTRSVAEVVAAQSVVAGRRLTDAVLPYSPVVDGVSLAEDPFVALAEGRGNPVDVIVGTNLDEWRMFDLSDGGAANLDEAGLARRLGRILPAGPGAAEAAIATYRRGRRHRDLPVGPPELWSAMQTDRVFRAPAMRLCELIARAGHRAYGYLFTQPSPVGGGYFGACHVLEVPYVWGITAEPTVAPFVGEGADVAALARRIGDAWCGFAAAGTPGGLPAWPVFDPAAPHVAVLGPGGPTAAVAGAAELAVWDGDHRVEMGHGPNGAPQR